MFTATCSFKKDEASAVDMQDCVNIKETYREVLSGRENEPILHSCAPSVDSQNFKEEYLPAHPEHFNPLPGLHLRKVDMTTFNKPRQHIDRRQLNFYTLRGALPNPTAPYPPPISPPTSIPEFTITKEANLHAAAHLYASDRNSLFIVPNHLDRPRDYTRMASLSHSVIFHVGIKDLIMAAEPRIDHPNADPTLWEDGPLPLCNLDSGEGKDADGRKWFVQEAWVARASGGRGLHMSRLFDYESGVHVATTFQDGLIRFKKDGKL